MSNEQNAERNERRAKMLEKVRKLLSMAKDGRGNANEEETAMRQANKIMAEYGIEEAECDMAAIDAGEMVFGEAQCTPDGNAPEPGKVYKNCPAWAGVLSLGVAYFTDTICKRAMRATGQVVVYQGEKEDVLLARWVFGVLVQSIQAEQKRSGWTGRSDATAFRMAAASVLQSRMKAMQAERIAMYEAAKAQSQSRALMVVDRKQVEIASRFGQQGIRKHTSRSGADHGARIAGQEAGQRINIPSGRPVGQSSNRRLN